MYLETFHCKYTKSFSKKEILDVLFLFHSNNIPIFAEELIFIEN